MQEKALLSAVIILAYEDLKNNLVSSEKIKGLNLSERINDRREAIRFFNSKYFIFYSLFLSKSYEKTKIQDVINSSEKEFQLFLKIREIRFRKFLEIKNNKLRKCV